MLSLDVSRCAGDMCKTIVNTREMLVSDMGKRSVFQAVASGGAGELLFTMNLGQTINEVVMCSMVGFVIGLGNTGCDDSQPRFCFKMFEGRFIVRIGCAQLTTCVGDAQQTLKPLFCNDIQRN